MACADRHRAWRGDTRRGRRGPIWERCAPGGDSSYGVPACRRHPSRRATRITSGLVLLSSSSRRRPTSVDRRPITHDADRDEEPSRRDHCEMPPRPPPHSAEAMAGTGDCERDRRSRVAPSRPGCTITNGRERGGYSHRSSRLALAAVQLPQYAVDDQCAGSRVAAPIPAIAAFARVRSRSKRRLRPGATTSASTAHPAA